MYICIRYYNSFRNELFVIFIVLYVGQLQISEFSSRKGQGGPLRRRSLGRREQRDSTVRHADGKRPS